MTRAERDAMIVAARPIVARYLMVYANRYPPHVQEDAIADGLASLPRAAERYDASFGMSFQNYAIRRAVGAMIDGLREQDHLSRAERKAHNRDADAAAADGRDLPGDGAPVSFDFILSDEGQRLGDLLSDPAPGPDVVTLEHERDELLHAAISRLPIREQLVVQLSFFDRIPLAEIAPALGVTESRVSQIRAKALERMRPSLQRQGLAA